MELLAETLFFLLFLPHIAYSDDSEAYDESSASLVGAGAEPDRPELKVPGFGGVNVTHSYLSSTVERLSQRIDGFFGEDRIYEEATGSYIQASGSLIYGRGGEFDFDGKFRVKVDLPQLKEKVNLVIESDDESDTAEDFNRITTGGTIADEIDDSDVTAALQFMLQEKRRWSLAIRPGLKFSDPIQTFIKLRFRRSEPLSEKWLSRGTVELAYFSDRGLENEWRLDLEREIGDKDFFRSSSTVLWREDIPGNQLLTQAFLLTHLIDQRQSLAFEIGSNAETRPNLRDLTYFSSLRYRRDIHRGWLFFEVKPQVIYTRENDFRADPALVLTLEALLGAKYLD